MLLLTDSSQGPGGLSSTPPEIVETKELINPEPQVNLAEEKPTAPSKRSRKRVKKPTASTGEDVSQKASKTDRQPSLRFHFVGGADSTNDEARNLLASLDDPALELVEGPPRPDSSSNGDGLPEIVGVVLDGAQQDWTEKIHQFDQSSPRPVVVALIKERSSTLMRRALRAGADEVLFMPLDPNDVTRALLKVAEIRRRTEHSNSRGRICSFMSLTGGAGVTTLSGSLALALSYRCNKRVGLVDLNLQSGGLGVFLNLEPEQTISLLIDERRQLDSIQLESTLTRHNSGIHLLAAPKRVEESEGICETTVVAVLDLMRQLFDFVVVDCGSHVNENVAATWERSDQLFYVIDQSIAAARCAVRFIDLFGRLHLENEPAFILNRFDLKHPVTEELINRTLARPVDAKIANDQKAVERSQLSGHDLWQTAGGSALVRNVDELAQKMTVQDQPVQNGRHNGLVARLLSTIGLRG